MSADSSKFIADLIKVGGAVIGSLIAGKKVYDTFQDKKNSPKK